MWISYTNSEVNVFHPVCEEALNRAIIHLGLNGSYEVLHHQYTGPLEMDFVIRNKNTGKYLCVVEVKRTPTDVHSARYQYQAMSYVQMNDALNEKPFYILTNLEYAFCFRYDAARPRVFQQMLAPGLHTIGLFSSYPNKDSYIAVLSAFFADRISEYINNHYEYSITLEQFASYMESIKRYPKKWKSGLAVLLYEYIRGAFICVARNDLRDIRLFMHANQSDVERICREAIRVNFHEIFNYSIEGYEPRIEIENDLLRNLFEFGQNSINGNSVAAVLHQIVSANNEHNGEVPTDLELGRIIAIMARSLSGELRENDKLCDPAAGSGNLISAAMEVYNLNANQIVANDINPQLGELLSLRLGLNFAQVVGSTMHPSVSHQNIADLSINFFKNVKVIVMNPPFLAGINAVERKDSIIRRIYELRGRAAETNIGQMPLEATFIELISYLVEPGTIIACVFPKTHLIARGNEAQIMRQLMLNRLGLCMIFTYPGTDIFTGVTKDTCVFVGRVMQPCETIKVISSYETIPNMDLQGFENALNSQLNEEYSSICAGVVGKKVSRECFEEAIEDGWRDINSEMLEAINYVEEKFRDVEKFKLLEDCEWKIKRGVAANSGGSDLLFFDTRNDLFERFEDEHLALKAGFRNAEVDSFITDSGDSAFLDSSAVSDEMLDTILNYYISLPQREGRQTRKKKSVEEWKRIVRSESGKGFAGYSVLIPRALRKKGRVYLVSERIFVSTNFIVCYGMSKRDAMLLGTWVSTIFYQLICEISSKDQEGMRKMEVKDIQKTIVPDMDMVSEYTYKELRKISRDIEFINLNSPIIRDVDRIWANELFGEQAEEILEEAQRLLEFAARRRNQSDN